AVARLAEFVLEELQIDRLVVAFDRKDFAQDAFQTGLGAFFGHRFQLQEAVVGTGLHVRQGGHLDGIAETAEVAYLGWQNRSLCRDGHGSSSSQKNGLWFVDRLLFVRVTGKKAIQDRLR